MSEAPLWEELSAFFAIVSASFTLMFFVRPAQELRLWVYAYRRDTPQETRPFSDTFSVSSQKGGGAMQMKSSELEVFIALLTISSSLLTLM